MKTLKRHAWWLSLVLALALSACGSDDDNGGSSSTDDAAATADAAGGGDAGSGGSDTGSADDDASDDAGAADSGSAADAGGDTGTAGPGDLVAVASGADNLKTLVAAVKAAKLVATLQGTGPFTVFAPTDDAFAKIPKADLDALIADEAKLKAVLLYHVVPGKVMAKDVKAGKVKTAGGAEVEITVDGGTVKVGGATVTKTDIEASNGVVHLIDTVIMPPEPDLVAVASGEDNLKTLVAAVKAAKLVETLQGEGPFTVFAPTDDAFAKIPKADLDALLADEAKLKAVLLYHVVPGKVMAKDVKAGMVKTAEGSEVEITVDGGTVKIGGATVTKTDIGASNGVVHLIDTVIMPPEPDLVAVASGADNLKTLVAAVKAAKLVETLQGKGPFTVFAPTDDAFAKIPKADLDALLADEAKLKAVLLYHVVPGKVMAKDVKAGMVKTAEGSEVEITVDGGTVKIGGATVTKTDIGASNGVVHLIDTVIMPPEPDLVGVASGNPDFKTLVAAVTAAKLVETLQGEGPFTVFAPNEAAFAKIPKATLDALIANPALLKRVLLYHVVPGKVMAKDVKAGMVKTADGTEVEIKTGADVMFGAAKVIKTDVGASNGVIHVIDTVVLPPKVFLQTIGDFAAGQKDFSTLVAALKAAKLVETLNGKGPFTVFAPNDAAFAKIPKNDLDALLKNVTQLTAVLLHHVLGAEVMAADVKAGEVETAGKTKFTIEVKGSDVMIQSAGSSKVIDTDYTCLNGVVHVVDTVIMPKQ